MLRELYTNLLPWFIPHKSKNQLSLCSIAIHNHVLVDSRIVRTPAKSSLVKVSSHNRCLKTSPSGVYNMASTVSRSSVLSRITRPDRHRLHSLVRYRCRACQSLENNVRVLLCDQSRRRYWSTHHHPGLLQSMASIVYLLLSIQFQPSSIGEAIRLALLAFSSSIFLPSRQLGLSYPKACLLQLDPQKASPAQFIWPLMVSAVSVFDFRDDSWLQPLLWSPLTGAIFILGARCGIFWSHFCGLALYMIGREEVYLILQLGMRRFTLLWLRCFPWVSRKLPSESLAGRWRHAVLADSFYLKSSQWIGNRYSILLNDDYSAIYSWRPSVA